MCGGRQSPLANHSVALTSGGRPPHAAACDDRSSCRATGPWCAGLHQLWSRRHHAGAACMPHAIGRSLGEPHNGVAHQPVAHARAPILVKPAPRAATLGTRKCPAGCCNRPEQRQELLAASQHNAPLGRCRRSHWCNGSSCRGDYSDYSVECPWQDHRVCMGWRHLCVCGTCGCA